MTRRTPVRLRLGAVARLLTVALGATLLLGGMFPLAVRADAAPPTPVVIGSAASAAHPAAPAAAPSTAGLQPGMHALLVVMDVSGSMGDSDGAGTQKIEGAKEAVLDFIGTVPDQTLMGLNTYPGPGSCDDGVTAIPLAPSSSSAMDRHVRQLKANGGTPTAEALLKAGRDLSAAGARDATIVLVSDGHSNCGDPCVAAGELAAQGIDITVNTVGFQIDELGRSELQCIADATSGTYFDAEDSDDLAETIAASTVPELTISLDPAEQTKTLVPGNDNTVEIKGTVTNTGLVVAPNVEAVISYDAQFSPGSVQPRFRLGNLHPGESESRTWTFRPLDEFSDSTVSFQVQAFTRGFETNPLSGSVRLRGMDTTDDIPTWLADAQHIVVMGDSYSSGEGAGYADPSLGPAFDHPTDEPYNSCHRSNRYNTGGQLADLLGGTAKVTTIACSGAVTLDYHAPSDITFRSAGRTPEMYHRSDGTAEGQPLAAQKQALRDLREPIDLVLMTLGGNDLEFADMVAGCIAKSLSPIPIATDCDRTSADRLPQRVAIERRLPLIYQDINLSLKGKGPSSQTPILVLAYPIPFPVDTSTACPSHDAKWSSLDVDLHFPIADRQRMNRMVLDLNASVKAAVNEARSKGVPVWFVGDTATTYLGGRTYCHDEPWINRATGRGVAYAKGSEALDHVADQKVIRSGWDWLRPDRIIQRYVSRSSARFLRDRTARWGWMNQAHPTRDGYKAMASQVMAWSAKNPTILRDDQNRSMGAEIPSPNIRPTPVDMASGSALALAPGDATIITADGFAPGSRAVVMLNSDPEHLGFTTADDSGSISTLVWLRPDVPLGSHHLVAEGIDPDGEPLEIRRPIEIERPLPSWWWPAAGATALLFVGGMGSGGSWLWLKRKRKDR